MKLTYNLIFTFQKQSINKNRIFIQKTLMKKPLIHRKFRSLGNDFVSHTETQSLAIGQSAVLRKKKEASKIKKSMAEKNIYRN